ncbi:hypothetical protein AGMMS50268_17980 [Spirochaetia bacterium]|nr:hypothetical protein AGMMS50268_17980 [Spirochaetia bacterium]
MRPVDHFLSQLDKLERSGQSLDAAGEERVVREFVSLCAAVIGAAAAEGLGRSILDRLRGSARPALQRLGFAAAFLLGEFDDSMKLDNDDWEDIRETLEDVSGEIDLDTLTALMGELLSRGVLKPPAQ